MSDPHTADELQVKRMIPRLLRMIAEVEGGVPRAALRRRLNSREKHLFDAALNALLAADAVLLGPAAQGGTRYICKSAGVALTADEEPLITDTERETR